MVNGPRDNRGESFRQDRQIAELERMIGTHQFCHPQPGRTKPQSFNKGRDQANQFFAGEAQQYMQLAAITVVMPPKTAPVEGLVHIGAGAKNHVVPGGMKRFRPGE
jgi:hypothetical protein